jgi:hypothetical protein
MRAIRTPEILVLAATAVAVALLLRPNVSMPGASAAARPTVEASDFELTIAADKDEYAVGEQPVITVTLANHSDEDVMLAHLLDGSDFGRFPQYVWTITAPEGAPAPQAIGRCGNTNPITTGAFFTLRAGESVELDTAWCPVHLQALNRGPGVYSIQANYSTDDDDPRSWIGGPLSGQALREKQRAIAPLLDQVPRLTLKSNTLDLRFVAPDRSHDPA